MKPSFVFFLQEYEENHVGLFLGVKELQPKMDPVRQSGIVGGTTCQMHVKFMHELCSLLLNIPTYLDVMRCYNHDFH
jgi:hypothetical protein